MRDQNPPKKKYNFETKRKTEKKLQQSESQENKELGFLRNKSCKITWRRRKPPHDFPTEIMAQRMFTNPSGRQKK